MRESTKAQMEASPNLYEGRVRGGCFFVLNHDFIKIFKISRIKS